MCESDSSQELPVTFRPELYLQRRGWVLDIMRREGITEVLDIGCGEGELLACLCNPAPWLAPPPTDVLDTSSDDDDCAELHKDILHPVKIAGLDIDQRELEDAVKITRPPSPGHTPAQWHCEPLRWEPLEAKVWEGSLAHVNPEFVGVDCVVSTEVIEHLPEDVLQAFAPVVLGAYHPRIVLLTTPSYTFNARFTAPDAPFEARSGWPDPTRRTKRIFRHHDHKFEWTVEEFTQWCNAVAEEWGYDVELGGVGKAEENDEWERDDELGWASQVAEFRRREGAEWAERRAKLVAGLGIPDQTEEHAGHKLLATHRHSAHEAAHRPQSLEAVGDLVVERMLRFRNTTLPLREIWFQNEVAVACGGWLDWLVRAVRAHTGLSLQKPVAGLTVDWAVQLDPALHHLMLPESPADSPPDTDEVADIWDPFDDDEPWIENPEEFQVAQDETCVWGAPEGDWSCDSEWS
ncbi:uncharacterized protein TRAVEDRAFT_37905 [Trametes versicolor FP-101664 SS1]|uniref:uncharacterized protein n=1 Tax=Trametes versicolor (strain FP-101664) TaxID=717944 RepID=UPI00046247D2|nr:uncharacterized protein TRAVEDRAFT_37905 [Trametes versicolor FP-101664 SS1]EIW57435.1 hypothetical protein TRAVEDRAFT_37905 [Trametes versicolor FP-101664 SS1]